MTDRSSWPIVALFHGSRNPGANTKARVLVKKLTASLDSRHVEVAFLTLAKPGLKEVISRLAVSNPRRITIVPVFLFKGTHVTHDIDAIVAEVKADFPVQKIVIAEPIGACPELVAILEQRIDSAEL